MNPDMLDILLPHWVMDFASIYLGASIIATVLVNVLPPPSEISWKPWVIFFNTMQRLSVHRPAWNKSNGPPKPTP